MTSISYPIIDSSRVLTFDWQSKQWDTRSRRRTNSRRDLCVKIYDASFAINTYLELMLQETLVKEKKKIEKKMESGNAINHRDLQDHRDHRSTSSPHPLEKFLVRKVRSRQRDQDESTRAETKRKKRPYRR
uniref:Uncharacterized protein n=1 Tax=Vespula pensylvanica TaxID=30213 RepID=A0A834KZV9_VESPE|nr:hypothetical protein H0235_013162 [Vespula pensylvanica]